MERTGRLRLNPDISYFDLRGIKIKARPEYLQTENVPIDDNWTDIKGYAFMTGYPTENHEELIDRVIRTGSKEGDLVLDAFAGSGTTLAVAEKRGRRWIGMDCGKLAIYTIQKRMLNLRKQIGNQNPSRYITQVFMIFQSLKNCHGRIGVSLRCSYSNAGTSGIRSGVSNSTGTAKVRA
jgi:site-specific DNA-methyltransferase (adenine-specific)/adenine-specific DNA-methyltransferase